MNCLLGHPRMTKKEQNTPAHLLEQHPEQPAQFEKKANASGKQQLSQKLTCDARRSLVGVRHDVQPRH